MRRCVIPDLEYNINANVTGGEEVTTLKEDLAAIEENPTVTVDASGISEAATGLESIETSNAPATLDKVGTSAGDATVPVGGLGASFKDMVAAIGVAQIAGYGLDFVLGLVRSRLDFIAETKAWDAAQVEAYRAAVDEVGVGLDTIEEKFRTAGEFTNEDATGLFGLGGGSFVDAASTLGHFGFTVDDVATAIRGGDEAMDAFENRFRDVSGSADLTGLVMGAVRDEAVSYGDAINGAAERAAFFSENQTSANAALQSFLDQQDPMRRFTSEWDLLMESISDGSLDTTAAADALNTISDGLGLTTEQVLALAQAQVDKTFEEAAAGAQAFAEAVGNIDFDAAEIQGATTAFSAFTTELFAAGNEAQARETAFDAMAASVENATLNFHLSTEAGRAQQDALEGIARVVDTDLATAYDNANGSQEGFMASAREIGEQTLARLKDELNLSAEGVETLAAALGLTEGDYQARFELAGAEEAQLKLGLLSGAITGLPPSVELTVNTQILAGDYVGALATVQDYYADPSNAPTATVEVDANTTPATDDIEGAANADHPHATIEADADTVVAASDLLATASEDRTAVIFAQARTEFANNLLDVAAGDRTANIYVNALLDSYESAIAYATRPRTVHVTVQATSISNRFGNRAV